MVSFRNRRLRLGKRASNLWGGYAGWMSALLWLSLAASLEAGGDAIVRAGLRTSGTARIALFLTGAIVLFSYGYSVNTPRWDFGRLLGVYVTLFFLVAQRIGWIFFDESPSRAIIVGGALILAGGTVITYWK